LLSWNENVTIEDDVIVEEPRVLDTGSLSPPEQVLKQERAFCD